MLQALGNGYLSLHFAFFLPFFFLYLQPSVFLHSFFDSPEHDEAALHCLFCYVMFTKAKCQGPDSLKF